ncbi:MAG: hypothetical protein SNJ75_08910 [Gemmataceae bacterium]
MKIYSSHAPEVAQLLTLLNRPTRGRRPRPRGLTDLPAIARCPRCRFEIVARMSSSGPVLWCQCAARLPRPAA